MAIDRGAKDIEVDAEEALREFELRLDRLKILYEQYFMGIEKVEPHTARKEVTRRLLELSQRSWRNAATRYRFNALNQKYGVYTTYWSRTLRAIENGTYYRSIVKAGREAIKKGLELPDEILRALPSRMRARIVKEREVALVRAQADGKLARMEAQDAAAAAPSLSPLSAPVPLPTSARFKTDSPSAREILGDGEAFDSHFDQLFDDLSSPKTVLRPVAPAVAPAIAPRPTPLPRSVLPPGMTEDAGRDLFARYVQAKKVVGEPTDSLTYESVMSSLARQAPKIMATHDAKAVQFGVVIRDGKVVLKATPKK